MIDYEITIIRPLILIPEDAIKAFANAYQFSRVLCQCPVGQNSMRRKTENLIQEAERIFPNIRENLAQASIQYGSTKALKK